MSGSGHDDAALALDNELEASKDAGSRGADDSDAGDAGAGADAVDDSRSTGNGHHDVGSSGGRRTRRREDDDDDEDDGEEGDWKRKRRGQSSAHDERPEAGRSGPDKRQRRTYDGEGSTATGAGAGSGSGSGSGAGAGAGAGSSSSANRVEPGTCVKLRGLPYGATDDDIRAFLKGCAVSRIILCHNQNGDGFVVLESPSEADNAIRHHRENMGKRYVEVYKCEPSDVEAAQRSQRADARFNGVIKMRGLPYDVTEGQIREFFDGYSLAKDGAVTVCKRRDGRGSGDAYVVFTSESERDRAMSKNKEKVGSRWVDMYPATKGELYAYQETQRPKGVTPEMSFAAAVHVKGLPYSATEADIREFFRECDIVHVYMLRKPDGRALGAAYVLLKAEGDVPRALGKDRQTMGGRWLEVYKASRTELFRATGSVAALRPDASFEGVVVASGLPFRLSPSNLVDFFKGYEVVRNGVFIINHPSGRPSGDAYIVFRNPDDAKAAVRALDGKSLDGRSVNLRVVTKGALYKALERPPQDITRRGPPLADIAVHVKGLPFMVHDREIRDLFSGLPVRRVINPIDQRGRGTGDAFVEFDTPEAAQDALCKNREHVGPRYVELFLANKDDISRFLARFTERRVEREPRHDRYTGGPGGYGMPPPYRGGYDAGYGAAPYSGGRGNFGPPADRMYGGPPPMGRRGGRYDDYGYAPRMRPYDDRGGSSGGRFRDDRRGGYDDRGRRF